MYSSLQQTKSKLSMFRYRSEIRIKKYPDHPLQQKVCTKKQYQEINIQQNVDITRHISKTSKKRKTAKEMNTKKVTEGYMYMKM